MLSEDRRQMTDDRGQRTDDRRQMTEDRGQKAEDGRQMADLIGRGATDLRPISGCRSISFEDGFDRLVFKTGDVDL